MDLEEDTGEDGKPGDGETEGTPRSVFKMFKDLPHVQKTWIFQG